MTYCTAMTMAQRLQMCINMPLVVTSVLFPTFFLRKINSGCSLSKDGIQNSPMYEQGHELLSSVILFDFFVCFLFCQIHSSLDEHQLVSCSFISHSRQSILFKVLLRSRCSEILANSEIKNHVKVFQNQGKSSGMSLTKISVSFHLS